MQRLCHASAAARTAVLAGFLWTLCRRAPFVAASRVGFVAKPATPWIGTIFALQQTQGRHFAVESHCWCKPRATRRWEPHREHITCHGPARAGRGLRGQQNAGHLAGRPQDLPRSAQLPHSRLRLAPRLRRRGRRRRHAQRPVRPRPHAGRTAAPALRIG